MGETFFITTIIVMAALVLGLGFALFVVWRLCLALSVMCVGQDQMIVQLSAKATEIETITATMAQHLELLENTMCSLTDFMAGKN